MVLALEREALRESLREKELSRVFKSKSYVPRVGGRKLDEP